MKNCKLFILFTFVSAILFAISSCHDDDIEIGKLREIVITGEMEIDNAIVKETTTITLSYNPDDQLIEYTESYTEAKQTFTLSYSENKVTIHREGNYYGEYTLNSQGYATSFDRPYTSTCYYEYSDGGYLTKAIFDAQEYTYTYEHGNLIGMERDGYSVVFTSSAQEDPQETPSFYQPAYLHIPGNFEVKIGYLAGLYGKLSYNLIASVSITNGIGQSWENTSTINYTYKKEHGHIMQQTEVSSGKNNTFKGELTFIYD